MGLCLGKAAPHPSSCARNRPPPSATGLYLAKATPRPSPLSSWPDLPPDVASLVLCRLDSNADRLRFGAACRDWRIAARRHRALRGTTPWLNVGPGVYQSLDGEAHRFCCHGSSGSLILYYHDPVPAATYDSPSSGGRCLFLRNPFHASSASIEILWPCREPLKIFLLCSALSIAVILHRGVCTITPFWPADMSRPSAPYPWLPLAGGGFADMAFRRGKIFALTPSGELLSHGLFGPSPEVVVKPYMACDQPVDNTVSHLVVSADKEEKLLMVRWSIPPRKDDIGLEVDHDHHGAMDLHVFEANLSKGEWSEVKEVGGQSLLVSKSCCRALGSDSHPRFLQGNSVYILGIDWHQKRTIAGVGPCKCRDCHAHVHGGIPSYCVYDIMTDTLTLVSLGGGHRMENAMSEWFFPCE